MQKTMTFDDVAIAFVKEGDYGIYFGICAKMMQ